MQPILKRPTNLINDPRNITQEEVEKYYSSLTLNVRVNELEKLVDEKEKTMPEVNASLSNTIFSLSKVKKNLKISNKTMEYIDYTLRELKVFHLEKVNRLKGKLKKSEK